MPYIEIPLTADPGIVEFVRKQVEPILREVRQMLEFPKSEGRPGFDLSATVTLCGVLGGLSRVFYNAESGDKKSFLSVAERYAAIDPAAAPDGPAQFAENLYIAYRCNLVHSLGLNMQMDKPAKRWKVYPLPFAVTITRWSPLPLSDAALDSLEQTATWPANLPPTLTMNGTVEELNVDAFYCGIRRLVKNLAEDATLSITALGMLAPWLHPQSTHFASRNETLPPDVCA